MGHSLLQSADKGKYLPPVLTAVIAEQRLASAWVVADREAMFSDDFAESLPHEVVQRFLPRVPQALLVAGAHLRIPKVASSPLPDWEASVSQPLSLNLSVPTKDDVVKLRLSANGQEHTADVSLGANGGTYTF